MKRWMAVAVAVWCTGFSFGQLAQATWGAGASSSVRVDARMAGGGRLAAGTEALTEALGVPTCDGISVGGLWETAALADGWHTLSAETNTVRVLTLNAPQVKVVGGRLTENTQWGGVLGGTFTYVVRHWVVVPKDVTLTIGTDAVVKFAPGAGIWVEDGGQVGVRALSPGEGAVFTDLADDAEGGDTNLDGAVSAPEASSWRVVLAPDAIFDDEGQLRTRYGAAVPRWGSVSVGDAVTSERFAEVRVPITLTGSRQVEYVEWETVDGTAKAGEDYVATSGFLYWGTGAAATQYATIPLLQDGKTEETETFSVRLKAAWGVNVTRGMATVTLNDASSEEDPFVDFADASGISVAVRVDARERFGGRWAHGVETLGGEAGAMACDGVSLSTNVWDSASVADGPHTLTWGELTTSVVALNAPEVSVEGGRLAQDVVWNRAVTHVVRHWVVVPQGVTLKMTEGTVVKFAPGAGIWVEDGGALRVEGSASDLVTFTHGADADFGARVTFGDEVPEMNAYAIVKAPGGTFEDNGWLAARWLDVATFGRVTLHPATAAANAGEIRIPVTVSGTREAPFTVRWVAEAGTAKPDEDYLLAEGELSWTGTKEGTKHIVIPTRDNSENTGRREFSVRVLTACGMNASAAPVSATLYRNGAEALMGAAWHVGTSAPARVDVRGDEGGRLAHGTETLTAALGALACDGSPVEGAWETATLADGWHTLSAATNAVRVLTLNGAGLAVEGGRLAQDAVWGAEAVHVVRHWVVVPKGVTLAVAAGTVAKFAPGAGIWVEDGGTLTITGEAGRDVVFTHLADDSVGGDTDASPSPGSLAWNAWRIVGAPGATLSDNGFWQVRYHTMGTGFAALTLHDALMERRQGEVWVPLTVSGARTVPFSVDWAVERGVAEPLTGTLTWGKVADGTKFIHVPVPEAVSEAGFETLALRLTAVRGANIRDREAAVTVYDAAPAVEEAVLAASWQSAGDRPTSPRATVQTLSGDFQSTLILDGQQAFRYSPHWQEGSAESCVAEILCARTDGKASQTLFRGAAGEEGEFLWKVRNLDDGEYLLTHRVVGPEGKVRTSVSRLLRYIATVELHGGFVAEDETWGADRVHLVYADVTVAAGKTLTIEPGAIVKFCDGTGLYSEDYTATTLANGVTFTHFADDTCGGDTNLDGNRTQPRYGTYTLGGHIVVDGASDIRCRHPQTLASLTDGQSMTLESGNIYLVEKNLTFASGSTLTIEPGVIVKFSPGTSLTIAQGATLLAKGTRAAPIVLTSIKDDAHGGDTNGDGVASTPQAGDWHQVVSKGTVLMEYTSFLYCSAKNNQGGFYVQGGTAESRNCVFAHCAYDCCRVVGGTFRAENCVFTDSSMGAACAGGSSSFVNCVFNNLTIAVRWAGGSYTNCIFSDIASVFMDSAGSQYSHCVYWNAPGYGPQNASVVGRNGNVWGDPCFVDPAGGDFHILPGSVAVDMADGSVAPALDFYGQPRMDVEEAANTGTPSANGAFPDAGIHELMPRTATADIDLAVVSVEVPASGVVGQTATFAWTVRNIGSKAAEGTWRDTLSLVNDAGEEIPLGTFPVSGYVAPDGTKRTERTLTFPPMGEGAWRLRVVTNAYRDLFEGTLVANNVQLSEAALNVSVEALSEGVRAMCLQTGQWQLFRVLPRGEAGYIVDVRAAKPVRMAFSVVPFRGAPESDDSNAEGSFPVGPAGGWLYVANGRDGDGIAVSVALEKRLSVAGVSPGIVPVGTREVTISVRGAGFTEGISVSLLREGGAPVRASVQTVVLSSEILAQVILPEVEEGTSFGVKVSDARREASLPKALLVSSRMNLSGLKAELRLPDAMRPGRVYEGAILYENTATEAIPVPLFKVFLKGAGGRLAHIGEGKTWGNELFAVGLGVSANRGLLQPGECGRLPFLVSTDGAALSVSFATVATEDLGARASLWPSYPELARALSAAVAALAPTFTTPDYDGVTYLDWAAQGSLGTLNGVLSGRALFPDGQPAAGVSLDLKDASGAAVATLTADASGRFRVSGIAHGSYRFAAEWLQAANPATVAVQGCVADLTVVCAPLGRLCGTVVDARGAPVAGAKVQAVFEETFAETTTDGNGAWSLLGDFSSGGVVGVRDASGFHGEASLDIPAVPLGATNTTRIVVSDAGSCSGTVRIVGEEAVPEGFALTLQSAAGEAVATVAVAADGSFAAGGVPVGTYALALPYGFAVQGGGASVAIGAGQETRLALTLVRTSPIAMPPAYQHEGGAVTYTVTAPGASDVRWDFDGDGTIDAVGPTVNHSYAAEGDYHPTVTYVQNGEEKVWVSPESIVVCPTAIAVEGTISVCNGSGWEVVGQSEGEVRLRRTADPASLEIIEPGNHLLLWTRDNPAVAVTEVSHEGDVTVCAITDASLNDVFVPATPRRMAQRAGYEYCYLATIPIDTTWNFGFIEEKETGDFVFVSDVGDEKFKSKFAFEVKASGELKLWKNASGKLFLMGSVSLRYTPSVTFAKECQVSVPLFEKGWGHTYFIPTPAGIAIPVYWRVEASAIIKAKVGMAYTWSYTTWQTVDFTAGSHGIHRRNIRSGETPGSSFEFNHSFEASIKGEGNCMAAFGIGVAEDDEFVSLAELGFGGGASIGLDYRVSSDEFKPDEAKVGIDVKANVEFALFKARAFGFDGAVFSCELWKGNKTLWDWSSSTPMPKIHYDIPAGGAPGEVILRPDTVCHEDWSVVSREWFLGQSCLAEEEASEDEVSSVRVALPCLTPDNGEGERDLHAGDILLRHYVCDREGKWTFLPDTWKAARRHIAVFVEDGVTQPMDTEGVAVPQSCDPNEMAGPEGVGERRLVKPGEWVTYTIYFENKADATGAAQEVRVTQQLDPRLDWATFELVDVAYRNQIESGLAGKASGSAESTLAGTPYKVRTEAAYDAATGAAEWYLRIVDDTTPDKWPADAYAGILPPNNAAHEGEGHITYRVKVREDAPDGAHIDASATIVFDLNEPIATDPAWWNTVAHTIASARFDTPTLEVQGPEGAVRVIVHGGSPEADAAVTLRVLGGTMALGKDYAFPEATTLRWEKGDTAPKTLTIAFDEAALALGDKTILLGLEDAQGLALEAEGKVCAITLRRHIPTLAWPEGKASSEALAAWVTEAAARQLITDGPLTFAPGITPAALEQARILGIYPEMESLAEGGASVAVDVSLAVIEIVPDGESLFVTAKIRANRGFVAEPSQCSATFTLHGGPTLEETTWQEMAPRVMGRPTIRSSRETTIPLSFPHVSHAHWFFRLRAAP